MTESRGVLVRVRTLSFPLKTAACRGAAVAYSRDNVMSAVRSPWTSSALFWTSSASSGLLLPLLDFFCLFWTSSAAVPEKTWPSQQCWEVLPPSCCAGGGVFWWSLALLGAVGTTKTNSVPPPVSLLGDQWTHAPTNAYACGLLPRLWSRPLSR